MDASQSLCHDVPDYAMKKAGNLSPAQELCRLLHSGAPRSTHQPNPGCPLRIAQSRGICRRGLDLTSDLSAEDCQVDG